MYQSRKNVFETNSSSTHAICINDYPIKAFPSTITFAFEDFAWENEDGRNPYNYLWTAINSVYAGDSDKRQEWENRLREICMNHDCQCEFYAGTFNSYEYDDETHFYLQTASLDHYEDLSEMLEDLFNNDTLLINYLIDANICTGNDNSLHNLASEVFDKFNGGACTCYWKGN